MADHKKPVITVVGARPMTDDNFKNNSTGATRRTLPPALIVPPLKSNKTPKTPTSDSVSSNVVKNKLKIFESLHANNKTNYSKLSNAKPVHANKPPVPATRKLISNAKSELALNINNSDLKKDDYSFSQFHQQFSKTQNDFGSVDGINTNRSEMDSTSYSHARSIFGGNWISDKEAPVTIPGHNKATIIRPKSSFINDANSRCEPVKKDGESSKMNDPAKPCLPRKPTIIRPKPMSKSMVLLDFDKSASDKVFRPRDAMYPDLVQSKVENAFEDNFKPPPDVKNIDLLAGLDHNVTFQKRIDQSWNIPNSSFKVDDPWSCAEKGADFFLPNSSAFPEQFQEKKSVRPPRPSVGPKIQKPQVQAPDDQMLMRECEPQGPRALALYDYFSGHPDDLIFKAGDTIVLDARVDETWFRGHRHLCEEQGMFPANFVEIIQPLQDPLSGGSSSVQPFQDPSPPTSFINEDVETRPRCIARYDFDGLVENGELCFVEGETIILLGKVNNEWLEGELSSAQKRGMFPSSFVEIIQDLDEDDLKSAQGNGCLKKVVAVHDFDGERDGDLNFKAGEVIEVVGEINDDWMEGRIGKNSGIFPSNFVLDQ